MKRVQRILLLALTLLLSSSSLFAQSGVIISELCDPQSNYLTDRFIEVFNATESTVSLNGWRLVAIGNGDAIYTWNLSGDIVSGEALVAGDNATTTIFQVDFPGTAWSTSNSTWNGKIGDGALLLNAADEVVDSIRVPGTTFENMDMVRKADVLVGSNTYVASEWTAVPCSTPDQASPGTHTVNWPVNDFPVIDGVAVDPVHPSDLDTVTVTAVVTDPSGNVTEVALNWGLASDLLDQSITMSLLVDSLYQTDSAIPVQSGGSEIFYRVTASSDTPDTNSSPVKSYTVAHTLSLADLQGMTSTSPYDGSEVVVKGFVAGVFPGHISIQDTSDAWNGLWVRSDESFGVQDSVTLWGVITETDNRGFFATTLLEDVEVQLVVPALSTATPLVVTTSSAQDEMYEGLLVSVTDAACVNTMSDEDGRWVVDDGSGELTVGVLGTAYDPILGSSYQVVGVVRETASGFMVEPRDETDITWLADEVPPIVTEALVVNATLLNVKFSETVTEASAEAAANYSIDGFAAVSSELNLTSPNRIALVVDSLGAGEHLLIVSGVEDEYGNAIVADSVVFEYVTSDEPIDYYDTAWGVQGDDLRLALHDIIDDHTALSYAEVWIAFKRTDAKPNGKVWDIYSDTPGETPPNEFTFVVDQDDGTGGASEGEKYNREHSWPNSWFDAEMPMYTDLFALYPVDKYINGKRSDNPYGEVGSPTWTSVNGSMLGASETPGYTGTVFEPIDEYKGDLARTYFYMTTRYYGEDTGWSGSDMVDRANLRPWAMDMLLAWSDADPVSQKEIMRNNAIYAMQHNRNPFIDHPEFIDEMFSTLAVGDRVLLPVSWGVEAVYPNPFNASTLIRFGLPTSGAVRFDVYDLMGRHVATLINGQQPAGWHTVSWNASSTASGTYFLVGRVGDQIVNRKLTVVK